MSIEGKKNITDARRGTGIYDRLIKNMDECHSRGLIFGASVTVTTENIKEVSCWTTMTADAYYTRNGPRSKPS